MTNKLLTTEVNFESNGEEIKLSGNMVKNYLVRGNGTITDSEMVMYLNLCKYQKLNPFLNEAYLVKFGSQPAQIIVSKEAFMKRAENHPKYEGFEAGIIVEREGEMVDVEGAIKLSSDKLLGGWAKIYRSDRKTPVTVRISIEEFSKAQATWKSMPLNMIRKSAIVNAQREAFPEALGALYTEDDADVLEHDAVESEIESKANTKEINFVEDIEPESITIHETDGPEEVKRNVDTGYSEQDETIIGNVKTPF